MIRWLISGQRPYFLKDFLQRFLAFRLPQKNTVSQNCYLLSVICNAKNSFWETVNCQTVTSGVNWHCPRNRNLSSCFKNRNLFFLFKNCNTVSCKNWKSWCQWPVPVTSLEWNSLHHDVCRIHTGIITLIFKFRL